MLGGTADGDGVDAVRVPITVAVISLTPPVPRSPDEDGTLSLSPLKERPEYIVSVIISWGHCHAAIRAPKKTCMKLSEMDIWGLFHLQAL